METWNYAMLRLQLFNTQLKKSLQEMFRLLLQTYFGFNFVTQIKFMDGVAIIL